MVNNTSVLPQIFKIDNQKLLNVITILAVPDSDAMRDRLNRLKYRQWFRPVAPMIADEALERVFGKVIKSPYMTMAPIVRDEMT